MTDLTRETSETSARGLSLFRVAGTEIRLDYSWLLICGLIVVSLSAGYFPRVDPGEPIARYWIAGGVSAVLFFASIVLHELAHAAVARSTGIGVPSITLFLFGGVAQMDDEPHTPGDEFRIAIAGPLASFALAGLFYGVSAFLPASTPPLVASLVDYLALVNTALGAFNLLPGYPLDGGRVLRAAVWWSTGSLRRGTRFASDAGKGLAVGLMVLGAFQIFTSGAIVGGLWLVLMGMFLRSTAEAGYQNMVLLHALEDVSTGEVAIRDVVAVSPEQTIQQFIDDGLLAYGFRAFPVVDGGAVRGLISIAELKDLPAAERESTTVEERMLPVTDELCIAPSRPLPEALRRLPLAPGGRLLVMQGNALLGLLTKGALTRFLEIRRVLDESPRAVRARASRRPATQVVERPQLP